MDVAFTGSQHGMSTAQLHTLREWTFENIDDIDTWHHGVCVGADTLSFLQAYQIFESFMDKESLATVFHFHPPVDTDKMSDLQEFPGTWHKPKPYLVRNHEMVNACNVLFAAPHQDKEIQRSGTWATIRYARSKGIKVMQLRRMGGFI